MTYICARKSPLKKNKVVNLSLRMSLHKFISIVIPALIAVLSLPAHTSAATAPDSIPDIELEGVVVTAPMREITVRGDTVLINAAAYKVREGARDGI